MRYFSFTFLILFMFSIFFVNNVFAQTTILESTEECTPDSCTQNVSGVCKQYCGAYDLNDGMELVKRISNIILAVVGSLSLLAFVAGGVMFLISGGNQNLISRGKATIIGAVIGLFIVFFSYTIISFITKDVLQTPDDPFTTGMTGN